MNRAGKAITALLLLAVIGVSLGGCGTGEGVGVGNGTESSQSNPFTVKTGEMVTDSWGYTGSAPIQVAAPDRTALGIEGHSLLVDASHSVVSGVVPTSVKFSESAPSAAARAIAPAQTFLCYVDISLGSAVSASPTPTARVKVGVPGETLTIYNYDAGAVRWTSAQTSVVDATGWLSFPVNSLSLWGIFR